jgi:hypothetical protein
MNENILEDFFYEGLIPCEQAMLKSSDYSNAIATVSSIEKDLKKGCPHLILLYLSYSSRSTPKSKALRRQTDLSTVGSLALNLPSPLL